MVELAHDSCDFDFASKYELPIIDVVRPTSGTSDLSGAYVDDQTMWVNFFVEKYL